MKEAFTIEELRLIFKSHHEKYLLDHQDLMKKIDSGEVEKAPWMDEFFSISLALMCMCEEISKLKEQRK